MADSSIKNLDLLKKQVSLEKNLKEKTTAEEIKSSKRPLSDAEIEAKLNQIINDIQHGNISVDDAVAALLELGIVAQVTTKNKKTVFKFSFKGKQYTVYYTSASTVSPSTTSSASVSASASASGSSSASALSKQIDSAERKIDIENSPIIINKRIDNPIISGKDVKTEKIIEALLKKYREELNKLYCPDDISDDIMQNLKKELISLLNTESRITDLKKIQNHLDKVFNGLVKVLDGRENIDVDVLFGDKDEMSLAEFMESIKSAINSCETGSSTYVWNSNTNSFDVITIPPDPNRAIFQKLKDTINEVLSNYSTYNSYDKEDLDKCIVILMNQAAGIENNGTVSITKETIKNLNKSKDGFFETLDKVLNADGNPDDGLDCSNLDKLYYFGINSYIDNFGQGLTGDCWLLASLSALNATESGQQVIKDSIETITKTDENGNEKEYIRVSFNGIGISYDISYEEMVEARICYAYSYGDNDVLAFELATEKLRRDIAAGVVNLLYANLTTEDNGSPGGGIYGGYQEFMLYYLTGKEPTLLFNEPSIEDLNSIYENYMLGNYAGYFSLGHYSEDVEALTTDNEVFTWKTGAGHAFAIVDMTETTITIANPWHPDKPYEFTWDEFVKLHSYIGITTTITLTLDEYKEKLQGDEFDRNVSGKNIKSYLSDYQNLFMRDLRSRNIYNPDFFNLLTNFLNNEKNNDMYDNNTEYNLKDALNNLQNMFDELTNSVSGECLINQSGTDNDSSLNRFVNYIISDVYNNRENNKIVEKLSENEFKSQLIQYLAEKYGKIDELEQTGSINLAEIIQDSNGNNSWLDEFFAIVKDFKFVSNITAINDTIDCDAKFTINGKEYTVNDIWSSDKPLLLDINEKSDIEETIGQLLEQIKITLHDIEPSFRDNIIDTLESYYCAFARAGFNGGNVAWVENFVSDEDEILVFDTDSEYDFGLSKEVTYSSQNNNEENVVIHIDIKKFIQKMLQLIDSEQYGSF